MWTFTRVILVFLYFTRSLPFENKDDPQSIEEQIAKGEVKMPRDIDKTGRDLLQ